ncbi:TRAP transporter large permease [Brevundimonas variabilis]|uniref:TRAP transporter large permease protein n=1 Tax=Brevundimonas variabilis TaxID=74312 RepID=A0A7W9CKX3_9CAUL|nr:TRAP transporter large permease [Brevundimonas variabilis]MBB5747379.1 tripartite ATP-independent transporter DctM subunit [Brevundimonas variabilis]
MEFVILFGLFAVLLAIGVPVAFSLLAATLATVLYLAVPPIVVFQQMGSDITSVSLLAIPLFIFTGELMMKGGLSDRMIALAASMVGHVRGGLGQVTVVGSTLFGGVSGSAIADVSAIGGTMIPQMQKRGYDADYAVNVTISAALVALLVPPSHNMILYSAAAGGGVSISDLFAAGILPAGLLAISLMITAYVVARKRGYAAEAFPGFGVVLTRLVAAIPGLLLVAIIFTGIRAGVFTAVESASIAVVYATVVTGLVYRQMSFAAFREACMGAVKTSGAVLFIIGAAGAFGWLMAYLQVPAMMVEGLQSLTDSRIIILLLIIAILLVLGTFMDMAPLIIICTPIFLPVAKAFGVDPVQFGVILLLNAGIGLITPPVGSVLFVGSAIAGVPMTASLKSIWPFYLACMTVLMLVTFVPALSLWLPSLMK